MKISARNTFEGKISALNVGPVSAEVEIITQGGDKLIATITQGSAQSLGLAVGKEVIALIKASNVMVMTDGSGVKLSARNCLSGKVKKLVPGPVSAEVIIALPGGAEIFASVTREATDELGLKEGSVATAVIKASSVIIGIKA
ncbi:TOBE domain-containing protein [Uliginosibacterium gangwonense]|uniref:TOBE domain-containing protein n=1 Tax=Uliginosibacterium gangwonense TaxID=392736 RepID=UPI0003746F92|nr:TOBE domain-containing protein [Uliginosibacterium gangwonense]